MTIGMGGGNKNGPCAPNSDPGWGGRGPSGTFCALVDAELRKESGGKVPDKTREPSSKYRGNLDKFDQHLCVGTRVRVLANKGLVQKLGDHDSWKENQETTFGAELREIGTGAY